MANATYNDVSVEARTFTATRKWFSANDDKAWAEKFYLTFIPVFFAYNALIQGMGWLDVGNFWHFTQNFLMWFPYCVMLPWYLRRKQPIPFFKQWWFKFQLYLVTFVFFMTYFNTEYFFKALGMRYNFPQVTWYFDSAYLGPDQATALDEDQRIPIGMYLNAIAFFVVYHIAAIIVIRRLYGLFPSRSRLTQIATFLVAAWATALFFAWAESYFYMTASASGNVWYINLPWQLQVGSWFYMLYFICSFPNIYGLDESPNQQPWSLRRVATEAAAISMLVLLLCDLWVVVGFPTVPGPA
jgi:cycloeucalenol cycloisomerase